jgi:hypothetical protein
MRLHELSGKTTVGLPLLIRDSHFEASLTPIDENTFAMDMPGSNHEHSTIVTLEQWGHVEIQVLDVFEEPKLKPVCICFGPPRRDCAEHGGV